jgi:hypothetical protein
MKDIVKFMLHTVKVNTGIVKLLWLGDSPLSRLIIQIDKACSIPTYPSARKLLALLVTRVCRCASISR